MALTGTFLADFTQFTSAVSKAEVSLKSFEGNAGKVGTALDKASNSLSGVKIVQQATIAAEAVERIGGVSKLTEKELERLGSTAAEAVAKMRALGHEVPQGIQKIADAAEAAKKSTSSWMGGFVDQVKATAIGFVSAQAVIGGVQAAFKGLAQFIGSSVQSYAEAEAAQKKLTAALTSAGRATPDVISQMNHLSSSFQKTTVYSDDLLTEMQALLTEVGNVAPGQMEKALKASTDLASGLGIDLRQATMLVGKAFEGETGTLKRYGIVIDEAKLKAEGMPAVLDAINARFGGQAAAEAETYAGKVKQLANAWDDFKESVGKSIVEDPVLQAALRGTTKELQDTTDNVTLMSGAWAVVKASAPDWVKALGSLHSDLKSIAEEANTAAANLAKVKAGAPALDTSPDRPNQFGAGTVDVKQYLKEQEEAQKKAAAAAEAHAAAIRKLRDEMSGARLQADVKNLTEAFNGLTTAQKNNPEILSRVGKAAEALRVQGADLSSELFIASVRSGEFAKGLLKIEDGLGKIPGQLVNTTALFREFSAELPIATARWEDYIGATAKFGKVINTWDLKPPDDGLKKFHEEEARRLDEMRAKFDDVAGTIAHVGSVFGGVVGSILNGAADIVGGIGDIITATNEWDRAMSIINLGIGLVGKAWNALFGSKGRDAVKDFAADHGGFDALHKELNALGAEGERLWINLTQGVGKNNPEQARKAIEAITDALGHVPPTMGEQASAAGFKTTAELKQIAADADKLWKYMRDSGQYSAEAVQKAWERANDALIASGDETAIAVGKAQDSVKKLQSEYDSIFSSWAAEDAAPEFDEAGNRIYGVVEMQQRARLDAIQNEMDAKKEAIAQAAEAAGVAGQTVADQAKVQGEQVDSYLRNLFGKPMKVPIEWVYSNPLGSGGGGSILTGATLAGGGAGEATQTTNVILDGDVIATATAKRLPRVFNMVGA